MEKKVKSWLFVYGTLKRGFHWHHLIEDLVEEVHVAEIIGEMYSLGLFPGIILSRKGTVCGEAVKVKDIDEALERCDHLEGFKPWDREKSHYLRREVIAFTKDGWKPCYAYEYNYKYHDPQLTEKQEPIEVWKKGGQNAN